MVSERVLVVEDEESVAITLRGILEQAGYVASEAQGLKDAFRALDSSRFDVVLLDLRLGSDDGLEVLQRLRATAPDTVVVILTGYGSLESAQQALHLGAFEYLLKPCPVDTLKEAIARGLARRLSADLARLEIAEERAQLAAQEEQARQAGEEARAEAERTAYLRDRFLAVAAHELKTPLTGLRGYAQLLLRRLDRDGQIDPARLRRALGAIDRQSLRAASIVEQMLDALRLEDGKIVLERDATDVTALVDRVAERARAHTDRHAIVVHAPEQLVAAIDPRRMAQVLTNLVENAIRYSPDGGAIEIEVTRPTRGEVALSVTDHGVGIPPEHRPRIFDRFYQAHADSYLSGLGLGLFVSRQIVELHGGTLEATFPAEGGSRFIARFPGGPPHPVAARGRDAAP